MCPRNLAIWYNGQKIDEKSEEKIIETSVGRRPISKGVCAFCQAELQKNKMTQHLRHCKQRLAVLAAQEASSEKPEVCLFHIIAEGKYNPHYWLHFEMPATDPLWAIDAFLKDMWIDDLDHLSDFTINSTTYREQYEYEDIISPFKGAKEEKEEEEEEIIDEEAWLKKCIEGTMSRIAELTTASADFPLHLAPFPAALGAELQKPRSIDEMVKFLKEELARIKKEERTIFQQNTPEESYRQAHSLSLQNMLLGDLLDDIEDRSMDVSLERVLAVGQKFSYVYDFGSSTYITLKVLGERMGKATDQQDSVQLLAQNSQPMFPCCVCGQPATIVALGYYAESIAGNTYCASCAKQHLVEEGGTLAITNSPRTGVL